jgi:FtsP/CotA-like multicopper oxidase with cupredoxin domain
VDKWSPVKGDFTEPVQLYSQNGVLNVTMTADESVVMAGGSPITMPAYNGAYIGPTWHVHPGDTINMTLVNHLEEPTNFHFHGFHVSPSGNSDNVFLHIMPGDTHNYHVQIPADETPGLFWYHSHEHGMSSGQVLGGLSGLIVMEGLTSLLPSDLQNITTRQFALKDIYTMPDAPDAVPKEHDIGGTSQSPVTVPNKNSVSNAAVPDHRMINGVWQPTIHIAPGETQLWRFANIGANTFYDVKLDGASFHVIAEDANPVWETWTANHLVLPPGKRYEVLVQGPPKGTYKLRTVDYLQGVTPANALEVYPQVIGSVVSSGTAQKPAPMPKGMVPRQSLDNAPIAAHRKFVFAIDFVPGRSCEQAKGCGKQAKVEFTINGKVFDPNRIDVQPTLNTVEEWTLVNKSTEEHPFHIHVNPFQVMAINGRPYDAHGLQDIVTIPMHGSVVIRNPFMDFTGEFVFHCHILTHEDGGMMMTVNVVK